MRVRTGEQLGATYVSGRIRAGREPRLDLLRTFPTLVYSSCTARARGRDSFPIFGYSQRPTLPVYGSVSRFVPNFFHHLLYVLLLYCCTICFSHPIYSGTICLLLSEGAHIIQITNKTSFCWCTKQNGIPAKEKLREDGRLPYFYRDHVIG